MAGNDISFETLLAFAAGELRGPAAEAVQRALAAQPQLAARLERIRMVLETMRRDDSVAPPAETLRRAQALFVAPVAERGGLLDAARRLVASLVYDSRVAPAVAGFRGLEDSFQLSYTCGADTLDLECAPLGDAPQTAWSILGQIDSQQAVGGLRAELVRQDTGVAAATTQTDEHGVFRMEAPAGSYELRIQIRDTVIVFPDVELS